jgi:hypothetical protein
LLIREIFCQCVAYLKVNEERHDTQHNDIKHNDT